MRLRAIMLSILLIGIYGANFVDANSGGKTGSTGGCGCHYGGGGGLLQVSMGCHQVAMLEVQRIQSHGTMVVCGFQVVVDLT